MVTSSNGNIFRATGHLYGEFTGDRWIPHTKPVTRSFDVFFDLRLNKRLSKQSSDWWFETPSRPLCRHFNATRIGGSTLACIYNCLTRIQRGNQLRHSPAAPSFTRTIADLFSKCSDIWVNSTIFSWKCIWLCRPHKVAILSAPTC